MEFKHEDDNKKGRFFIALNNEESEITYVYAGPKKLIIDHTAVADGMRGKNVGKQLVNKVVVFARENNMKILPLCPFAKAIMAKNEDSKDILF